MHTRLLSYMHDILLIAMNETDGFHQLSKQGKALETIEFDPRSTQNLVFLMFSPMLRRQAGLQTAGPYSTNKL